MEKESSTKLSFLCVECEARALGRFIKQAMKVIGGGLH